MTTVASLTIEMAANVARLSRDMARARTTVDGAMAGIRGSVALAQRAFLGLGSGLAAAELLRMADAATTLQNRLKLATGSAREAAVVYREVFTLAQQSRVSFTDLGDTYAKLARNARQLGLSQADMLAVTESIGNALAISGGSAESMNAALVQLGQGFASGVLRGEELNSVMEQTPRLAQAIAEGMGVTIGQLKKLGEEGKLTADVVARAIASQQAQLKAEVGSTTQTVSQALTTVRNAGVLTVGILDDMTGVSGAVAASLTAVANGLTALGEGARAAAPYIKAAWDVIQPILAAAALVAAVTLFGKLAAVFSAVGAALSSIGSIIAGNATLALFLSGLSGAIGTAAQNIFADRLNQTAQAAKEAAEQLKRYEEVSTRTLAAYGLSQQEQDSENARRFPRSPDETAAVNAAADAYRTARQKTVEDAAKASAETRKRIAQDVARAEVQALAEARDAAREYARAWFDLDTIQREAQGTVGELSAAQQRLVEYLTSPAYDQHSDAMRAQIVQQSALAVELDNEATLREAATQATREHAEGLEALKAARAASLAVDTQNLEDQVRAQQEENERIGKTTAQLRELEIARLEESEAQLVQVINARIAAGAQADEIGELTRQIQLTRELIDARREGNARAEEAERAEAVRRAAQDAEQQWRRASDNIERSLTDALFRAFESGKGFGRSLVDTFVNALKARVANSITSTITGSAGAGTAQGGALESLGIVSSLRNIADGYNAALPNAINSLGGAMSSLSGLIGSESLGAFATGIQGATLAPGLAGPTTVGASGAMGAGAQLGSLAGDIAPYLNSIVSLIQGDVKGAALSAIGTYIGGSLGGPLGAAIGSFAGSLLGGLFGSDKPAYRGGGAVLTAGGQTQELADYNAANPGFIKGTLDRGGSLSDFTRRNVQGLDDASAQLVTGLGAAFNGILGAFGRESEDIALAFRTRGKDGRGSLAIGGESVIMAEKFKGSVEEAFQKFAGAAAGAMVEELRDAGLPEWADEILEAIDSSRGVEALQEAAQAIGAIMQAAETLRALPISNLAGITEASVVELAKLTGGLEGLQSSLSAYYEAFYSESERADFAREALGRRFAALADTASGPLASRIDGLSDALLGLNGATGLVGADFRALVESIDPNNEATRELLAQLLALAPAFAEVSRAAEQAATSVLDEIRRLRGSSETDGQSRAELQARFAIAQAQARAGDADALARLPEITRAIEQVAASTAVSALDIARERAYLRASLEQTLQSIGVSIPAFAEGGMHGGGLRLVGERGPEIEATGPARYWSAEQTAGMMGGSAERLERIEEALRDLMGPLASVAVSSRTSAEALDDSARGRRPLLTRTDA